MKQSTKTLIGTIVLAIPLVVGGVAGYAAGYSLGQVEEHTENESVVEKYLADASRIVQNRPAEESQEQFRTITTYDDLCVISITSPGEAPSCDDNTICAYENVVLQDGSKAVVTVYQTDYSKNNEQVAGVICGVLLGALGAAVGGIVTESLVDTLKADEPKTQTVKHHEIEHDDAIILAKHESQDEPKDNLSKYKSQLQDYITHILAIKEKTFFRKELSTSVDNVVNILRDISQFVEADDLSGSNVQKLTNFFLPKYLDMLTVYCKYYTKTDSQINRNYMRETKAAILQSEAIFKSILDEVLSNDVLDIVTDAQVYTQIAAQNGLIQNQCLRAN